MSESSQYYAPALSTLGGAGAATVAGATIGAIVALVSWSQPVTIESDFFGFLWKLIGGLLVGGVPGLLIGGTAGWHGGIFGSTTDRAGSAPLWGIVTGGVLGISIAPVLGGVVGLCFGHLVGGAVLGLILGPLVAIAAWEIGFWYADFFRAAE